ncbi:unnamed protein product [Lepeophtheirus salmonis]|uniref:(salmon louse) hypothetical protein n=1 Tax=Lepeophtheirus salmonis TaxID=72036 RepID=A0A7R8CM44_LEPSM|nr:unnamed protein product [Lepeophtheirus salmonis]CAF2860854.1 unnamed protein product [Lepeophtheirus salmonis]
MARSPLQIPKNDKTIFITDDTLILKTVDESKSGVYSCEAENQIGKSASKPLILNVKWKPEGLKKTVQCYQTQESLTVLCSPGFDGGMDQKFILEIYDSRTRLIISNVTNSKPVFYIHGLSSGTEYYVEIYAVNSKGKSIKTHFETFTLQPAEKQLAATTTDLHPITQCASSPSLESLSQRFSLRSSGLACAITPRQLSIWMISIPRFFHPSAVGKVPPNDCRYAELSFNHDPKEVEDQRRHLLSGKDGGVVYAKIDPNMQRQQQQQRRKHPLIHSHNCPLKNNYSSATLPHRSLPSASPLHLHTNLTDLPRSKDSIPLSEYQQQSPTHHPSGGAPERSFTIQSDRGNESVPLIQMVSPLQILPPPGYENPTTPDSWKEQLLKSTSLKSGTNGPLKATKVNPPTVPLLDESQTIL